MASFTSKILMVRPAAFGYNPQTAESNVFQVNVDLSDEEIQSNALKEFDAMVEKLRELGIEVVVFQDSAEPHTPDSVFPNNWFSTHSNGYLCLYPMEAHARRMERNTEAIAIIKRESTVNKIYDLTEFESQEKYLEGTGSLVLDHSTRVAYACISSRTNEEVLTNWAKKLEYDVVSFNSFDQNGIRIYHTNVMMCVGDSFAVVCLDSVTDKTERAELKTRLESTGKDIVEISFEQMNNFAGNMILLRNRDNEKILVMSESARKSLNASQIGTLESHAKIASFEIEMIEKCGGGSVRCMIAELF